MSNRLHIQGYQCTNDKGDAVYVAFDTNDDDSLEISQLEMELSFQQGSSSYIGGVSLSDQLVPADAATSNDNRLETSQEIPVMIAPLQLETTAAVRSNTAEGVHQESTTDLEEDVDVGIGGNMNKGSNESRSGGDLDSLGSASGREEKQDKNNEGDAAFRSREDEGCHSVEEEVSDSEEEDEGSSVDTAEENEKQVRKSLLFAILSAVGLIICIQLVGRLIQRCTRSSVEEEGLDHVVAAGEQANGPNSPNNPGLTPQATTQQMATSAAQSATTSISMGTGAASGGATAGAAAAVANASLLMQVAVALGIASVVAAVAVAGTMLLVENAGGEGFMVVNGTRENGSAPIVIFSDFNLSGTNGTAMLEELFQEDDPNTTSYPVIINNDTAVPVATCDSSEGVAELKEGMISLVLEGLPKGFVGDNQQELQVIFRVAFNGVSGMCEGYYQRILQSVVLTDTNTVKAGPDMLYTYTQWRGVVSCVGCPDDNAMFAVPAATATGRSHASGRRLQVRHTGFLIHNPFFTEFVEAFIFEIQAKFQDVFGVNADVSLFYGAIINPSDPQQVIEETSKTEPTDDKVSAADLIDDPTESQTTLPPTSVVAPSLDPTPSSDFETPLAQPTTPTTCAVPLSSAPTQSGAAPTAAFIPPTSSVPDSLAPVPISLGPVTPAPAQNFKEHTHGPAFVPPTEPPAASPTKVEPTIQVFMTHAPQACPVFNWPLASSTFPSSQSSSAGIAPSPTGQNPTSEESPTSSTLRTPVPISLNPTTYRPTTVAPATYPQMTSQPTPFSNSALSPTSASPTRTPQPRKDPTPQPSPQQTPAPPPTPNQTPQPTQQPTPQPTLQPTTQPTPKMLAPTSPLPTTTTPTTSFAVTGYVLVDTETSTDIQNLSNGDTIYKGANLTIRAETLPAITSSGVDWYVNGHYFYTDYWDPYTLAGEESNGKYRPADILSVNQADTMIQNNIVTITSYPYIGQEEGTPLEATFTLMESPMPPSTVTTSAAPSTIPSTSPSIFPSSIPTDAPSNSTNSSATHTPSMTPSLDPSLVTSSPTMVVPTSNLTNSTTFSPSELSSTSPTFNPTNLTTATPSESPARAPTNATTISPSSIPSDVSTGLPTGRPTGIPSSTPSFLYSLSPSNATMEFPSSVPSAVPSASPSNLMDGIPSQAPTSSPAPSSNPTSYLSDPPSGQSTLMPSSIPSQYASNQPSTMPSKCPNALPTSEQTIPPTAVPSIAPSEWPSSFPSGSQTFGSTMPPTQNHHLSSSPSIVPSKAPTKSPTNPSTTSPTVNPTSEHTTVVTTSPSNGPSKDPVVAPSKSPTVAPSKRPTSNPTIGPPTVSPTRGPSLAPTLSPTTQAPSQAPTAVPSTVPSTMHPTSVPTRELTRSPTAAPTNAPTKLPTTFPSVFPTWTPSMSPTNSPTKGAPTAPPTRVPTASPTGVPTASLAVSPTATPTRPPSSSVPTRSPTRSPTDAPTELPSRGPPETPTTPPTVSPTDLPSKLPSRAPTSAPTIAPSDMPTKALTVTPTGAPTRTPTSAPTIPTVQATVTFRGSSVLSNLEVFQIGSTDITTWFDTSSSGVSTPPGIELDNAGKISFAVVQSNNGVFVAVIYDARADNDGSRGGATVDATCNGNNCASEDFVTAVDPDDTTGGSPVTLSWVPCCEDGYVVGPFVVSEEACFSHSSLDGVSTARFFDGAETEYEIAADASSGELCILFS